jgi:hypothetical protein
MLTSKEAKIQHLKMLLNSLEDDGTHEHLPQHQDLQFGLQESIGAFQNIQTKDNPHFETVNQHLEKYNNAVDVRSTQYNDMEHKRSITPKSEFKPMPFINSESFNLNLPIFHDDCATINFNTKIDKYNLEELIEQCTNLDSNEGFIKMHGEIEILIEVSSF